MPVAPDMSALVASYEEPDGVVELDSAAELEAAAVVLGGVLERTGLASNVYAALEALAREAPGGEGCGSSQPSRALSASGYVSVTRICGGWVSPEVPDAARNGTLELTATFTERGLDPVIWGSALACRYLVEGTRVELSAPASAALRVHQGAPDGSCDFGDRALLFDVDLDATIDGERVPVDFDFRLVRGGVLEFLGEGDGGAIVVGIGPQTELTLRGSNGSFGCDAELECSRRGDGEP